MNNKLKIFYWPSPELRIVCASVTDATKEREFIDNLFFTMYEDNGIGLAASQVGSTKRIFVMDTRPVGGSVCQAFINPVTTVEETQENHVISKEGCLSFPNIWLDINRHKTITITNLSLTGDEEKRILTGIDSICAQHELDHLNGIVFFDYLRETKKQLMEEKLRKTIKKRTRK